PVRTRALADTLLPVSAGRGRPRLSGSATAPRGRRGRPPLLGRARRGRRVLGTRRRLRPERRRRPQRRLSPARPRSRAPLLRRDDRRADGNARSGVRPRALTRRTLAALIDARLRPGELPCGRESLPVFPASVVRI